MAIYKKFISSPKLDDDVVYRSSVKKYFTDLEKFVLDAGFIKSNTANNMDVENINFPSLGVTPNTVTYSTSILEFDFNDEYQSILPIRIGFSFGLRKGSSNVYHSYFESRVHIGIIEKNTNVSIGKWFYPSSYSSYTGSVTPIKYYDSFVESYIVKNDNVSAFCITPEFDFSFTTSIPTKSSSSPLYEFTIARVNDTSINVIARDGSTSSHRNTVMTLDGVKPNSYFWIYVNTPSYLTSGRLLTFPVFLTNVDNTLTQSDKLVLVSKDSMVTGDTIDIKVDDIIKRFVAMPSNSTYVASDARLLVGFD